MIQAEVLLTNANLITMNGKPGCGLISNGAVAINHGRIAWMGSTDKFDGQVVAQQIIDLRGRFISPGLIDCHSHLVFGGDRAEEWQMRLNGASYSSIAQQGGGILSTVKDTRAASEQVLFNTAKKRINFMIAQGVTTFEIKSGYGLDIESEKKMLGVATALRDSMPVDIHRTFLGAHAVPPEFRNRDDDYVQFVCREMLPEVQPLCDSVDVFCENIAFDLTQTERVFRAAGDMNLPIKVHAEQLSLMGGAKLAAEMGAISADHLEYIDVAGVKAMADSGSIAVLLPGAFYFIGETQKPPVELFRKFNVPIAVATDFNPGSSPAASLILMMNMACTLFGLTVEEAIAATTLNAAKALQRHDLGKLEVGKQADLAIWDVQSIAGIPYGIGHNPCHQVYKSGKLIFDRETSNDFGC